MLEPVKNVLVQARRAPALALLSGFAVLCLTPLAAPAEAAGKPRSPITSTPRCTVLVTPPARPTKRPTTHSSATPSQRDPQSVDVVVPRLRCTGRHPQHPGGGGGGTNGVGGGSGSGAGDGGGTGHIPYTGFELTGALQLAAALIYIGLLVVALTPRRPARTLA